MTSPCSSTSGRRGAARAAPSRPILDEIARDHDEVTIVKLNTDENPAITGQLGITSIPTMHVYQNGEIVKTIIGAHAQAEAAPRARAVPRLTVAS